MPNAEPLAKNTAQDHFEHHYALVEKNASVGKGTRIWAFVHILPGAAIGEDCNICDHVFIEGAVLIGDRVTIKTGVSLWDGVIVEDDVFIGPNAVFTNDLRPRSRMWPARYSQTLLKQGCSLGANSTILPGLMIGRWAMVGAGAVVTRSVPDHGLVIGVPARLRGWLCRCGNKLASSGNSSWRCSCGLFYELSAPNQLRETPSYKSKTPARSLPQPVIA